LKTVGIKVIKLESMSDGLEMPPDIQRVAFEEFGETVEKRQQSLEEFRNRLLQFPEDQRLEDFSDKSLIRFIRGSKYNMEKAVKRATEYQKFRKDHPEWFHPTQEEIVIYCSLANIMNQVDEKLRRIITVIPSLGLQNITPEFMSKYPEALTRFPVWIFDQLSHDPYAQVAGVVLIITGKNLSMWDSFKMSKLSTVQHNVEAIRFLTNCAPLRLKQVLFFEEPMLIIVVWRIVSLFLTEKLKNRFIFCGADYSRLANYVDVSNLPAILGGTQVDDQAQENWILTQL
jgi:hypothetical protein